MSQISLPLNRESSVQASDTVAEAATTYNPAQASFDRLSDPELIAAILGTTEHADEISDAMTHPASLPAVVRHRVRDSAAQNRILTALELARRLARRRLPSSQLLDRTDRVADYLMLHYQDVSQEVFGALFLDIRNRHVGEKILFKGSLSRTAVEPRAIFLEAYRLGASSLILFHTHPSGDPSPSLEDLAFTRRVKDAGEILGIKMHDHLILGTAGRWVSLRRRGTF